jgi:hypothetical protein
MYLESTCLVVDNILLAALILSEIPAATFVVTSSPGSTWKTFQISFLKAQDKQVSVLVQAYINREARVNLSSYNKQLNLLRDIVKFRSP